MANTENFTVVKGSFGYTLNFALKDSAGTARDLTGYSVKFQMWAPLVPATLLIDGACTWISDAAGTCYYTIPASATFPTIGVFQYAVIPYVGITILDPALTGFITVTQYGGNYCVLEEVKSWLGIDNNKSDDIIQGLMAQAKEYIDRYCDRVFSTVTETRYFDGSSSPLRVDDISTATALVVQLDEDGDGTYEITMAATDYALWPYNTFPKMRLYIPNNGNYGGFANGIIKGVKITATWGYPTIPELVRISAKIQTARWYKRKDTAFADVLGNADLGTITVYKGLDPDIKESLLTYRKLGIYGN